MKGSDRNKPCTCGSGLKAKRCDCRERAERARWERLNVRVVRADDERVRVAHSRRPLLAAALVAIAAGNLR